LPHDFGPGRIHDQSAYTVQARQTGFYLFAGADGRYVQYDWSLDGPQQSHDVPHPGSLPWVADGRMGLALDVGKHFQLTYGWTVLTFQMRGQKGYDGYGGVQVSYVFRW
jgi:hypothetical protein